MNLFDLSNRIILVTGGAGHLGAETSLTLAEFGAIVYVLDISEKLFKERFPEKNENIRFQKCDISSTPNIRSCFEEIYNEHGAIDVLITGAFYSRGQKPLEISDEDWAYSVDGVLGSVYRCIREIVPYFKKNGKGKIINIASMYGIISPDFEAYEASPAFLNPPHYGASKAGVIQLTRYFAQYLGKDNIQVNAVSPGPFPNEAVQKNEKFIAELEKRTALGRIGHPVDLAGAMVFLSSSASDYITGHNLVVDGGWTIK